MAFYKFRKNDIFINRLKTHPFYEFQFYDGAIFLNNKDHNRENSNTPNGHINLYELNVNRSENLIYPFIQKDGSLGAFKTISTSDFFDTSQFAYGDTITSSYPLTATLSSDLFPAYTGDLPIPSGSSAYRPKAEALKNVFDFYTKFSPHHEYSSSIEYGNKEIQQARLISIPSIFYGSSIKKGTVNLKFYHTGTLIGEVKDERRNGELVQVGPSGSTGSGSVAGVVLYNEGFLWLTGSWDISGGDRTDVYTYTSDQLSPEWVYFGSTGSSGGLVKSSFYLSFEGTHRIPTVTMMAHAKKGHLNHSNNPTYVDFNKPTSSYTPPTLSVATGTMPVSSGSSFFSELTGTLVKNTISSSYTNHDENFQRQTFISKIGIFDEHKNLIGVAKLANPVKKLEELEYTFKIKMDL